VNAGNIALTLFGNYYRGKRAHFSFLTNDLIKARLHITVERLLSNATLYSLVLVSVGATLALAVAALLFNYIPVWRFIFAVKTNALGILSDFAIVVFVVLACFMASFLFFIFYPRVRGWERKRKIDGHLPYAIGWMSFMAGIGVIPYVIFKKLAEAEEFFGEVSQEAKLVVKDVELLGFDFISALHNLASVTPSKRLRTFIQGAVTNSLSGGEMGSYFMSKAQEAMEENRKLFTDFISTLSLISEVYIVGLVAAPIFIIVMLAAMMMLRGTSPAILMLIIYGVIPAGSVMFLLVIDSLTPEGIK
jgi:archaeal flagellar protein FlaJ